MFQFNMALGSMKTSSALVILLLVGCPTKPRLDWRGDWKNFRGSKVELRGILFSPNQAGVEPHICRFRVTEDLPGCVWLINPRVASGDLQQLHNECVVAVGIIEERPPLDRRVHEIRAILSEASLGPCGGA